MVYQPKLEAILGLMKGGKSAQLIDEIEEVLGNSAYPTLILKPSIDTRDGAFVKSRAREHKYPAVIIDESNLQTVQLVLFGIQHYGHVFIDEVQFFSEDFIKKVSDQCYTHGAHLTVSGLLYDFKGQEFPSSKMVVLEADVVHYLKSNCDLCGVPASRDVRLEGGKLATEGSSIGVEGDVEYLSVCRGCYKCLK